MKIIGILVLLLLICTSCYGLEDDLEEGGFYETLRGFVVDLSQVINDVTVGIEKLGKGIKNVEEFLDATVEEDCVFECPQGGSLEPNPKHSPNSNGCGSLGLQNYLTEEMLPSSKFTNCCDDHDLCYGKCGNDKDECDLNFKKCLYKTCSQKKASVSKLKYKACQAGAKLLYTGTTALGCKPFINAQREACLCRSDNGNRRKDEF